MFAWLRRLAWRWYCRRWLADPDDSSECVCGFCYPVD